MSISKSIIEPISLSISSSVVGFWDSVDYTPPVDPVDPEEPVNPFPNSAFLANGTTDFNGIAYFDQIPVYGE